MGTPENVGVIGVAFFKERVRAQAVAGPEDFAARRTRKDKATPPRSRAAPSAGAGRFEGERDTSNIGTEYGESRTNRVVEVPFERVSNTPSRVITLRYDDADGLEARGIDLGGRDFAPRPLPFSPRPFADGRFAPPPP